MIERFLLAILLLHISAPSAVAQESARPSEFALSFCVYERANIRSEPSTAGGESTIIRTAGAGEPLIVVDGVIGELPAGWQNNIFWYELRDGSYVYSGIVIPCPPPLSARNVSREPNVYETGEDEERIRDVLSLLRVQNSELYAFTQIERITIDSGPRSLCAGRAFRRKIELWMGEHCSREYLATILIHEYCHIWQFEEGLSRDPFLRELACMRLTLIAGFALGLDREVLARDQIKLKHIREPECQWWKATWDSDQCQSHGL
ncbi:MAG: SH3 domain-containing protein [Chloroflexi bacterium]|nr:SH3 domain-containing protein [Chloroflexota bacterium]